VVDTNVWGVAEGLQENASDDCVTACLALLGQIEAGRALIVDTDDLILSECVRALRRAKTAGLAVKLAARLWKTRYSSDSCRAVTITPIDEPAGSFAEVPESIRDFDADDQKFFAVAMSSGETPPVFQALDGEWWERRVDLNAAGIDVQYVCASDLMSRDADAGT
jgi:hypothetical protein